MDVARAMLRQTECMLTMKQVRVCGVVEGEGAGEITSGMRKTRVQYQERRAESVGFAGGRRD